MKENKKNTVPDYFFINRKLLHSDRWLAEKFTRAQAWVDLFGLAQHTSNFFYIRGIKVQVDRGQLAYSQLSLAKRWKWSRDKVRRFLKCLENDGDIIQQNSEVTTLITIVNYKEYQADNTTNDTTEKQQKNNKQDTYKKNKNDKNVKKKIIYSPNFEKFWKEYPRKGDKFKASLVFEKLLKEGVPLEELKEGAMRYAKEIVGKEEQYILMGKTWLNGRRWEDPIIIKQQGKKY